MSTAFEHDPPLSEAERNKRIGTEVRVEMARRGVKQTQLAREKFGQSQSLQQLHQPRPRPVLPLNAMQMAAELETAFDTAVLNSPAFPWMWFEVFQHERQPPDLLRTRLGHRCVLMPAPWRSVGCVRGCTR